MCEPNFVLVNYFCKHTTPILSGLNTNSLLSSMALLGGLGSPEQFFYGLFLAAVVCMAGAAIISRLHWTWHPRWPTCMPGGWCQLSAGSSVGSAGGLGFSQSGSWNPTASVKTRGGSCPCRLQTGACQGHLPSASAETEPCAAFHALEAVQSGEWGTLLQGNWWNRSLES